MVLINVYLFDEEQTSIFYGMSSTGETTDKKIKVLSCKNRDQFVYDALKDSHEDEYTLICVDKMLTLCTPEIIYNILEKVIEEVNFDIFYLASWCDRGDLYDDIREVNNFKIVKVASPHGTACMLFSPNGRRKFLTNIKPVKKKSLDLILNPQLKNFKCYTTTPPMLEFDITQRDTDLEFVKVSRCREVPEYVLPLEVTRRNTTTLNLFWFILVLIIIVCIASILLSFTDLKKTNFYDSYSGIDQPALKAKAPYAPYDGTGDLKTYQRS